MGEWGGEGGGSMGGRGFDLNRYGAKASAAARNVGRVEPPRGPTHHEDC